MVSFRKTLRDVAALVRAAAQPMADIRSVESIVRWIGDASIVLLGEATHGTHDFYAARAEITRRLMAERGFAAVAIEGDWPDAFRVNRYVQRMDGGDSAADVLRGFARFPTWMWRNTEVVEFVEWLREHNRGIVQPVQRAGFYGLDLYSLHASMRAVVAYLDPIDSVAARSARNAYACFDHFGEDTESYAWATMQREGQSCEDAVMRELLALRERRLELIGRDHRTAAGDEFFSAEQNARVARDAEKYYRTMFRGRVESWNVRDTHMAETLEELLAHLARRGQPPKVVVWAHNSHVGDARGTELGASGELNIGQLAREHHGDAARLIGFTTHSGSVIAASDWGGEAERKLVRPALSGSYEELFNQTGIEHFFLPLREADADSELRRVLNEERLERAIGVIYRPETERMSHYFHANLSRQFDAVIHFDQTNAVQPLEVESAWDEAEAPETFPSGV